jgi:hypothetical protein
LYIYISGACKKISQKQLDQIKQSGCEWHCYYLDKASPNANDFRIVSELSYLIGAGYEGDVIIISNDKGFNAVTSYMGKHEEHPFNVQRSNSLARAIMMTTDRPGRHRRSALIYESQETDIMEAYKNYQSKKEFRTKMEQAFADTELLPLVPQIMELFENNKDSVKQLYLTALKQFGRKNGLEIYRVLKNAG